ncbi:MAG: hypothetical protein AAF651_01240 [Cyanobacteria bacterium P01_C01_bin.73]
MKGRLTALRIKLRQFYQRLWRSLQLAQLSQHAEVKHCNTEDASASDSVARKTSAAIAPEPNSDSSEALEAIRTPLLSDPSPSDPSPADPSPAHLDTAALEQEIIRERPFSLAEAIGREGSGLIKGTSPIPPLAQAKATVERFIDEHINDTAGALKITLQTWVNANARLSQHLRSPLSALHQSLTELQQNPALFYEFARQVNRCWGQISGETPHFQKPGEPPHSDTEYSHEKIEQAIADCATALSDQTEHL